LKDKQSPPHFLRQAIHITLTALILGSPTIDFHHCGATRCSFALFVLLEQPPGHCEQVVDVLSGSGGDEHYVLVLCKDGLERGVFLGVDVRPQIDLVNDKDDGRVAATVVKQSLPLR
jgi:hypothetical protein